MKIGNRIPYIIFALSFILPISVALSFSISDENIESETSAFVDEMNKDPVSGISDQSQQTPTQSSVEDISDEHVFDTISLDVKVNGSDGPVEVQKGGRIMVSWISEGASRCRAVWSKNDIAQSGTVAGRLSKFGSFSIRAACVDADGNRADDAVVVNVGE